MAMLGSHDYYNRNLVLAKQGKVVENFGFSRSLSMQRWPNFESKFRIPSNKSLRFQVWTQQDESVTKFGTNGRVIKMVSTSELVGNKYRQVNNFDETNGKKSVVNADPKLANAPHTKELSYAEDLKIMISDEGFSWANDNYNSLQRTIDVWSFVISFRVRIFFDNTKWAYFGGFSEDLQKKRQRETASWLRECMLQLGPTFIKLGQLFSSRSDLFPLEYVEELAKLQDRVPAFSANKAREFIKRELGASVDLLFKEFEDQPIAAASLGQVHRAVLHNGEKIVIKVQRPGLKKLFDIDLRNLKIIAEYFQKRNIFGLPTTDWTGIYKECSTVLYQEIDYINEGKNADRFRRDFRNIKWARVPMVFWDYTASKVLTLEYVPGVKINRLDILNARGYSRSKISARVVESYLIQMLKTGFFHADPHPGNLAIDTDEALIYYDFGMMGEIKSFTRERLLSLFYAVYENDANKVMQSLIDLDALHPTGDLTSVRRSVKFFLDNSLTQKPNGKQTLTAIGEDLFAIAADQPFHFPSTFAFVVRAFSTLEGIGYMLDNNFSFAKIAAPYAQELLEIKQEQQNGLHIMKELGRHAEIATNDAIAMPSRVQKMEDILKNLESGDLKLRVRVLESERAALKATTLQMATIYTTLGGTLLNLGVSLSSRGSSILGSLSLVGAGIFLIMVIGSMKWVKNLDSFEKMI